MQGIERRIARLREAIEGRAGPQTTFMCADGSLFHTPEEPLSFLHQYGAVTPDGQRIVAWKRPEGRHDPLSQSLLEVIDEAIERGGFPWSEV